MAPSTVFSYLRRDHRRASTSLAPSSPSQTQASPASAAAPQLPATFHTPKLTDEIFESGLWLDSPRKPESLRGTSSHHDQNDETGGTEVTKAVERKASSTANDEANCAVTDGESPDTGVSEQSVMGRYEQHRYSHHYDEGLQKPSSPWKRTFGKGFTSDGAKGEGNYTAAFGGDNENKPLPEISTGEVKGPPREVKGENVSRRYPEPVHEPSHSKTSKTRLNLLNPMALLARRRSAQAANMRAEDINISKLTVPALPDDYDPRIRGKLFHDFSVPRPRSTVSMNNNSPTQYSAPSNGQNPPASDKALPAKPPEHTPLFREHFDNSPPKHRVNSIQSSDSKEKVLAAASPPSNSKNEKAQRMSQTTQPSGHEHTEAQTYPLQSRPPTGREPSHASSGLPRHLTSSASRFSFDMTGGDLSSQEKILEEKHKEKEAARRAEAGDSASAGDFDGEFDDFDYDAMMDDDGLEERIPGVNADDDLIGGGIDSNLPQSNWRRSTNMNAFVPGLPTVLPSPISADANSSAPGSPVIGQQPMAFPASGNGMLPPHHGQPLAPAGLHSHDNNLAPAPLSVPQQHYGAQPQQQPVKTNNDDELYYDDGLFGELPEELRNEEFDESIFDDETSHLYDRKRNLSKPLPSVPEGRDALDEINQNGESSSRQNSRQSSSGYSFEAHTHPAQASDQELDEDVFLTNGMLKPANSVQQPSLGLTEGNLEAYHSALANAANEAALSGRFERSTSFSEGSIDQEGASQTAESQPGLTADGSRLSQTMAFDEVFDDFDYNDINELDDDPIIAEANADVLEHDDEGFYGEEFGFYAHSNDNSEGERVYGGYFGSRGPEGLTRNHSGRKIFREPSLTPITERSEWSTRNSIISLATHGAGHSNPSVSSPPLSQLVDMGSIDDEMTFSALLKLRRGAFGGSNGSLRSSSTSQTAQSPSGQFASHGSFSAYNDMGAEKMRPSSMVNFSSGMEMNSPSRTSRDLSSAGFSPSEDISRRRKSDGCYAALSMDAMKQSGAGPFGGARAGAFAHPGGTASYGAENWSSDTGAFGEFPEAETMRSDETLHGRI